MAKTIIFPAQEVEFNTLFYDTYLATIIYPPPFTLVAGETYTVQWGDSTWPVEAIGVDDIVPGGVAIGNGEAFGFPGNGEPFIIANWTEGSVLIVSLLTDSLSKQVAIYQSEEESPIVLKDRTGTGIEYEGVEGVRLFDKDGGSKLFVPPVEKEEKTVELDFSGGDMEVMPSDGKLLSKVGIPIPENLLPENIAKDVDIAGVVGTHEGGGGGEGVPYLFMYSSTAIVDIYNTYGTDTLSRTVNIPSNAIVNHVITHNAYSLSSSSSTKTTKTFDVGGQISDSLYEQIDDYTIPTTSSVSASATITSTSTQKYGIKVLHLMVLYSIPGLTLKNENGKTVLYGDSSVTSWPARTRGLCAQAFDVLDFREVPLSYSPEQLFVGCRNLKEAHFSPTITQFHAGCLHSLADEPLVIDLTNFTSIPNVSASTTMPAFSAKSGLQILVPASLYDEWITTSGWPNYASYIVPV